MDLQEAKELAERKIAEHCPGYRFQWNRSRRKFGTCNVSRRTITLSPELVRLNSRDRVENTIIHEICHALTPGDGHGRRWKLAMVSFGLKPSRCYTTEDTNTPKGKHTLTCGNCGPLWEYLRKPKLAKTNFRGRVCPKCRGRELSLVTNR